MAQRAKSIKHNHAKRKACECSCCRGPNKENELVFVCVEATPGDLAFVNAEAKRQRRSSASLLSIVLANGVRILREVSKDA